MVQLKSKLLDEISNQLVRYKGMLKVCTDNEEFAYFVQQNFALLQLKYYVENEHSFMTNKIIGNTLVYIISEESLDIWLQDSYSFVSNFQLAAEKSGYNVFPLLNDRYFEYKFVSIYDSILRKTDR